MTLKVGIGSNNACIGARCLGRGHDARAGGRHGVLTRNDTWGEGINFVYALNVALNISQVGDAKRLRLNRTQLRHGKPQGKQYRFAIFAGQHIQRTRPLFTRSVPNRRIALMQWLKDEQFMSAIIGKSVVPVSEQQMTHRFETHYSILAVLVVACYTLYRGLSLRPT